MSINKESELIHAILIYCQRCQDEGDLPALTEMGIGAKELNALATLSSAEKLRLASTKSHFMNISLDQKIFWRMINYIQAESKKESLVDELIKKGAPLGLMYALTGMGSKQFTVKRQTFGLGQQSLGRPSVPSDEVTEAVWNCLKENCGKHRSFRRQRIPRTLLPTQ